MNLPSSEERALNTPSSEPMTTGNQPTSTTPDEHSCNVPKDNHITTEQLFESSSKITLATAGGAVVGLSLERQQQQQRLTKTIDATTRRRAPPTRIQSSTTAQQLPKTWAMGCMLFTFLLETSRLTSPVSMMVHTLAPETPLPPAWSMTIGDCSLGGLLAGMAGAVVHRRRYAAAMPRPPLVGVTAGLALGCLAGCLQAGLDTSQEYLQKQMQDT